MRLLTRSERRFSPEEIALAMALAEQVGIAISHGRLFKEMAAQLQFLRQIQEVSTLVNSTLDLEVILEALVQRVVRTMRAKGCTLRLIDADSGRLTLAAAHGVSAAYLRRGEVEQGAQYSDGVGRGNRWRSTTSATISASTIISRWPARALSHCWRYR